MLVIVDEFIPECLRSTENLQLVDAGLFLNSPYPPFLGPKRDVDLIISLDFSLGQSLKVCVCVFIAFLLIPRKIFHCALYNYKKRWDLLTLTLLHNHLGFKGLECAQEFWKAVQY